MDVLYSYKIGSRINYLTQECYNLTYSSLHVYSTFQKINFTFGLTIFLVPKARFIGNYPGTYIQYKRPQAGNYTASEHNQITVTCVQYNSNIPSVNNVQHYTYIAFITEDLVPKVGP